MTTFQSKTPKILLKTCFLRTWVNPRYLDQGDSFLSLNKKATPADLGMGVKLCCDSISQGEACNALCRSHILTMLALHTQCLLRGGGDTSRNWGHGGTLRGTRCSQFPQPTCTLWVRQRTCQDEDVVDYVTREVMKDNNEEQAVDNLLRWLILFND